MKEENGNNWVGVCVCVWEVGVVIVCAREHMRACERILLYVCNFNTDQQRYVNIKNARLGSCSLLKPRHAVLSL